MAKSRRKITGRKRAKKSLEWQLAQAEDLQFKAIAILLKLEEIPDQHLSQAPLCRATMAFISDIFRKWQDKIKRHLEEHDE